MNLNGNTNVASGNSFTVVSGEVAITGRNVGSTTTLRVNNHTSTANIAEFQDAGTSVFTIADGGNITATQNLTVGGSASISGQLSLYGTPVLQSTANQSLTLGGSTTGNVNVNDNFAVLGSNTFTVGTGATVLGGSLDVTGLSTFNGGATVASGQSLTALGPVSLNPDGANDIAIVTDYSTGSYLNITGLDTQTGTQLCVDGSNNVVKCAAGSTTLQGAYNGGNTITTTDARNIAFTLADTTTDASFTLTNQGTANAFIIDDTNAATNTSLDIRSGGSTTLTIDELGNVTTAGDIAINGGDLTTTAGAASLFNSGATTLNIGGAATTVAIGATTGTTTVRNALNVNGLATLNGGATVPNGETFLASGSSTLTPSGSNSVTINTDSDSFLTLNGLDTPVVAGSGILS